MGGTSIRAILQEKKNTVWGIHVPTVIQGGKSWAGIQTQACLAQEAVLFITLLLWSERGEQEGGVRRIFLFLEYLPGWMAVLLCGIKEVEKEE